MITEEYVSYETAVLLKEKGFDEEYCYEYYAKNGELKHCEKIINNAVIDDGYPSEALSVAPTHQMALKWLREVHNIHCTINIGYGDKTVYFSNIYSTKKSGALYNETGYYDSYEEACGAAILYVLKNLI